MRVKELIAALSAFDPELEVMVDGYEGGVGDPRYPSLLGIDRDVNGKWFYGPHEPNHDSADMVVYLAR